MLPFNPEAAIMVAVYGMRFALGAAFGVLFMRAARKHGVYDPQAGLVVFAGKRDLGATWSAYGKQGGVYLMLYGTLLFTTFLLLWIFLMIMGQDGSLLPLYGMMAFAATICLFAYVQYRRFLATKRATRTT